MIQMKKMEYPYETIPLEERAELLPEKNICSIAPANDPADYLYTGNGKLRVDAAGRPYKEEIIFTPELFYEPLWAETPAPPDLRPYISDIRKYILEGKPELADEMITKAQKEAGFNQHMNLDAQIIYPTGSPQVHKAFSLDITQKEAGKTHHYLRFLDMHTGKIMTHWENENGVFESEVLPVFQEDCALIRFHGPQGKLNFQMDMKLPGGPNVFGVPTMVNAAHTLSKTQDQFVLSWAYDPLKGKKGYVAVLRFVDCDGTITVTEQGIRVEGASTMLMAAKMVRIEHDFVFGVEDLIADRFQKQKIDFAVMEKQNRDLLSEKMNRSVLTLGKEEDRYLSGEELLEKCHGEASLYPMMMDKLYDLGRFYQIIDTGEIPPMWGQHNINTNLQVCAGNNTGLFDEMDVYFKYYESKFADFRENAKLLFGARGLLASVHCDYDSGLFYHFSKTYPHYCWTGCLGWIYNEFWGYYLCTGDLDFLRERVIPALKEIALFFEDYACEKDEYGKSIFVPSFSPEDPTPNPDYATVTCKDIHAQRINSVMDIAICREVLTNLITACKTLSVDMDSIPKWEKQLEDLPYYLVDEQGALREWAWPAIEENYNHRHVSHHYDVWPGRAVTLENDPEMANAILLSNRKRGQQDDSAHGIIHRAFCAIRLKDQEETFQNLSQLICHGFVRRNFSTAHFPYRGQFPDLQGAMPALLLEMCVYAEPGRVELLPMAENWFSEGKIEGIWLYTWAKLENLSWNAKEIKAEIVSNKDQELVLSFGKKVEKVWINGECVQMEAGKVRIACRCGECMKVTAVK